MESFDHPFLITRLNFRNGVIVYGKYVWQGEDEKSWMLDRFPNSHVVHRAIPDEY